MESTLTPSHRPAAVATEAETGDVRKPLLGGVRRQLLGVDLCVIGFLGVMIGWTLLGMAVPSARLYPDNPRYAWAQISDWSLLIRLGQILAAYLIAQRFGIFYQRHYASSGRKAPLWLGMANVVYVFIPILLLPLVFNLMGAFISGVSGVPAIDNHPAFDPSTHYDHAATYWDLWLKNADLSLTGVYPARWLRQFHARWNVTLLLLCYLSYYVSPLVAVLPQVIKRDWRRVRRLAAIYAGALVATYVGYIVIPATGPRFEGGFGSWAADTPTAFTSFWQTTLDNAEVIRWDAFPSGHVALAVVALVLALRYHRKTGLAYLPFVLGLPLATLFLGYHYLTDVLAGVAFALGTFLIVEPAVRWWESIWPVPTKPSDEGLLSGGQSLVQ